MNRPYSWQKLYEAAVLETDFQKIQESIAKAEQAIHEQLTDSPPPKTEAAEMDAIGKTLAALAVLKAQTAGSNSGNGHLRRFAHEEDAGGSVA